jgi:hypothetical protein
MQKGAEAPRGKNFSKLQKTVKIALLWKNKIPTHFSPHNTHV